ncbi:hypothetical protein E1212_21940 [Jiangella ureilytica]|uniref:DUF4383 domain-containing protein n=1 Tax=Jiangella ureilytica TaxID=2530374 RepID=A0A4V2XW75_9ACTN|nr:hypothetical protein [Jiangella ureilytica]TDC48185.1 hypothetical protein E1212_21940 [Jiangella ureilytica]
MLARQRIGGAVVALIGALGVTASAYLDWYRGLDATDIPLERLFQTSISTGEPSSYWNSMALALSLVTVLGVVGALLLSRFVLGLGWLIGVATLVLWIVMSANDDLLTVSVGDLQAGVWVCAAGLLVMLVGIIGMGRGDRRTRAASDDPRNEPVPPPAP